MRRSFSAKPGFVYFTVHNRNQSQGLDFVETYRVPVPNQDTEYHEYGFDWQAGFVSFYCVFAVNVQKVDTAG